MASKSADRIPEWVSPQNRNLKNIKSVLSIPPEGTKFYVKYLGNSTPPYTRIQKYIDDDGTQHSLNEPLILEGVVPAGAPGTQILRTRSRTWVLALRITKCKENPSLVGKYLVFNPSRDQISLTPFKGGPRLRNLAKKRSFLTNLKEGAKQHQALHYLPDDELVPGTAGRHSVRLRARDQNMLKPDYLESEYDHDDHQMNNIMYFQGLTPDGYMLPPNPESGAKRARLGGKKKRKKRKTRKKKRKGKKKKKKIKTRRKRKKKRKTRKKRGGLYEGPIPPAFGTIIRLLGGGPLLRIMRVNLGTQTVFVKPLTNSHTPLIPVSFNQLRNNYEFVSQPNPQGKKSKN